MSEVRPPAIVSVATLVSAVDTCALCSVGPETLTNAVMVRNASGAAIEFPACDRCAAAVRRLIAAAGGAGASGPAQIAFDSGVVTPSASAAVDPTHDTIGQPVLVLELAEIFVAADGTRYTVRVWGQERSDGTWIGWLTFVSADGQIVLRTRRETSQSNFDHLTYWATGLQVSYLEGALTRAS